jgi:hypothetical protein
MNGAFIKQAAELHKLVLAGSHLDKLMTISANQVSKEMLKMHRSGMHKDIRDNIQKKLEEFPYEHRAEN